MKANMNENNLPMTTQLLIKYNETRENTIKILRPYLNKGYEVTLVDLNTDDDNYDIYHLTLKHEVISFTIPAGEKPEKVKKTIAGYTNKGYKVCMIDYDFDYDYYEATREKNHFEN